MLGANTDSSCVQSNGVETNVGNTIPNQGQDDSSKVSPNTGSPEDFNGVDTANSNDGLRTTGGNDLYGECTERTLAKNYYSLPYPTPTLFQDLLERLVYHEVVDEKKFDYGAFMSYGLDNFTSYAAHFCKYEAQNGAEIISVGSGSGAVEREIIATYRKHFGQEIKITLIDPKPDYEVDFKTVDDLIKERPNVVRNCVVFIVWPEPMSRNDGYDIEAVLKLQPLAVLTVYEPAEVSGSGKFTAFLYRRTEEKLSAAYDYCGPDKKFGLDNYAVEEVVRQEVYLPAGGEYEAFGMKIRTNPATRCNSMRMVRLKRTD